MYEYKVVKVDRPDSLERVLNEHAKEGWKVISEILWSNFTIVIVVTFERHV